MKDILSAASLKPVEETSYLTAQNVERYRAIMRFMYIQHQRMRYWLKKEEIFAFLRQYPIFSDYTLEDCQNDLKVLVDKKNLLAVQDTSKASTLEEFKNKRFKYMLSEISVELERLLEKIEHSTGVRGSLEPKLFEKMLFHLQKMNKLGEVKDEAIAQWWKEINRDFQTINNEYTDFISMLQGTRTESLISTEGFLIYKDKLIRYLNQFINQLLHYYPLLEEMIFSLDERQVRLILDRVVAIEEEEPRNILIQDREVIREEVYSRWENICNWFAREDGESDAKALIDVTTDIIKKMTSYALRIIENKNVAHNRREEYRHLARLFAGMDMEEAAKLSAMVFGVFHTRHIKGDFIRESENVNLSVMDISPFEVRLRSRTRAYREKIRNNPIQDKSAEKQSAFQEYEQREAEERELLQRISRDGVIAFENLPILTEDIRKRLLLWLVRGRDGKLTRTDTGRMYRVVLPDPKKRCLLRCIDGDMEMPAFEIRWEENEG
ncbi:MAG: TIGR02677 family protein [Clostridia bacterium]|jgi:uncharacterized protein (TIGR02677 family)